MPPLIDLSKLTEKTVQTGLSAVEEELLRRYLAGLKNVGSTFANVLDAAATQPGPPAPSVTTADLNRPAIDPYGRQGLDTDYLAKIQDKINDPAAAKAEAEKMRVAAVQSDLEQYGLTMDAQNWTPEDIVFQALQQANAEGTTGVPIAIPGVDRGQPFDKQTASPVIQQAIAKAQADIVAAREFVANPPDWVDPDDLRDIATEIQRYDSYGPNAAAVLASEDLGQRMEPVKVAGIRGTDLVRAAGISGAGAAIKGPGLFANLLGRGGQSASRYWLTEAAAEVGADLAAPEIAKLDLPTPAAWALTAVAGAATATGANLAASAGTAAVRRAGMGSMVNPPEVPASGIKAADVAENMDARRRAFEGHAQDYRPATRGQGTTAAPQATFNQMPPVTEGMRYGGQGFDLDANAAGVRPLEDIDEALRTAYENPRSRNTGRTGTLEAQREIHRITSSMSATEAFEEITNVAAALNANTPKLKAQLREYERFLDAVTDDNFEFFAGEALVPERPRAQTQTSPAAPPPGSKAPPSSGATPPGTPPTTAAAPTAPLSDIERQLLNTPDLFDALNPEKQAELQARAALGLADAPPVTRPDIDTGRLDAPPAGRQPAPGIEPEAPPAAAVEAPNLDDVTRDELRGMIDAGPETPTGRAAYAELVDRGIDPATMSTYTSPDAWLAAREAVASGQTTAPRPGIAGAADEAQQGGVNLPTGTRPQDVSKFTADTWWHAGPQKFDPDRPVFLSSDRSAMDFYTTRTGDVSEARSYRVDAAKLGSDRDLSRAIQDVGLGDDDALRKAIAANSPYDGDNLLDALYIPEVRRALEAKGFDGIQGWDVLGNQEIPVRVVWNPAKLADEVPAGRAAPLNIEGTRGASTSASPPRSQSTGAATAQTAPEPATASATPAPSTTARTPDRPLGSAKDGDSTPDTNAPLSSMKDADLIREAHKVGVRADQARLRDGGPRARTSLIQRINEGRVKYAEAQAKRASRPPTITQPDGSQVPATPEATRAAVERWMARPPAGRGRSLSAVNIPEGTDTGTLIQATVEQLANARTRGGKALFDNVPAEDIEDALLDAITTGQIVPTVSAQHGMYLRTPPQPRAPRAPRATTTPAGSPPAATTAGGSGAGTPPPTGTGAGAGGTGATPPPNGAGAPLQPPRGFFRKVWDNILAIPAASRYAQTSGDVVGAEFRQMGPLAISENEAWRKAFGRSIQGYLSDPDANSALAALETDPRFLTPDTFTVGGVDINIKPMSEVLGGNKFQTPGFEVPNDSWVTKFAQNVLSFGLGPRSEMSMRVGMWTAANEIRNRWIDVFRRAGITNQDWYDQLNHMARIQILYGDVPGDFLKGINNGFYSLRNVTGRWQTFTQPFTKPGALFNNPVNMAKRGALFAPSPRGIAARHALRFAGFEVANLRLLAAVGQWSGAFEVGYDPLEPNFGRISFNDDDKNQYTTDLLAGYGSLIKMIARSGAAAAGDERFDPAAEAFNYTRYKMAGVPALFVDTALIQSGAFRGPDGELLPVFDSPFALDITDPEVWKDGSLTSLAMPFFASDAVQGLISGTYDIKSPDDLMAAAGTLFTQWAGLPVSMYEASSSDKRNLALEKVLETGGPRAQEILTEPTTGEVISEYGDLDSWQRAILRREFPDFAETIGGLQDPNSRWVKEGKNHDAEITAAVETFKQTGNPDDFKTQLQNISEKYGKVYAGLDASTSSNYDREPTAWQAKIEDFWRNLDEVTNPGERADLFDSFEASLNPAEIQRWDSMLSISDDPLVELYKQSRQWLQPNYYEPRDTFYADVIRERAGPDSPVWKYETYDELLDAALGNRDPDAVAVNNAISGYMTTFNNSLKVADPGLDAMLYVWGYADSVKTPAARDMVKQWATNQGVNMPEPRITR